MLEYFGHVQRLALAPLVWIVLFPALGALVVLYFLAREVVFRDPPAPKADARAMARVAAASLGLTLAAAVYHVALLAQRPEESRVLYAPLTRMCRVGQLDVHLALTLDPLSAIPCVLVAAIATLLVAREALQKRPEASPRALAAACALVAGGELLFLADDVVIFLVGSQIAGASALVLFGPRGRARFVVERLGEMAILAGGAVLFWGLGGSWSDAEYVPDLNPRYVAVSSLGSPEGHVATQENPTRKREEEEDEDKPHQAHVIGSVMGKGATPPLTGKGYVTLASTPGALVYVDDAHTPWSDGNEPLRAPIVHRSISGGVHTFRVHPGDGSDDFLVTHAPAGAEADLSVVLVGGTLHFREIADQMALENARGEHFLGDAFRAKHLFGLTIPALLALLFGLGVLARAAPLGSSGPPEGAARFAAPLVLTLSSALPGLYLVARLAPVLGFTTTSAAVAAALVAVVAAGVAARTRSMREPGSALTTALGALGLASLALALSGALVPAFGLGLAVTLARAVPELVPAAGLGALGARVVRVTVVVLLAGLVVTIAVAAGLDVGGATVRAAAPLLAALTAALAATTFARTSGGAASGAREPVALLGALVLGAASVALAGSIVVGAVAHDAAWLDEWLAPPFASAALPSFAPSATAYGVGALALALVVFAGARVTKLQKPKTAAFVFGDGLADHVVLGFDRLGGLAVEVDRRVVDGIVEAGGLLTRAAAWANARFDQGVVDAPAEAATRGASQIAGASSSGRGDGALLVFAVLLPLVGVALYVWSNR